MARARSARSGLQASSSIFGAKRSTTRCRPGAEAQAVDLVAVGGHHHRRGPLRDEVAEGGGVDARTVAAGSDGGSPPGTRSSRAARSTTVITSQPWRRIPAARP